MLLQSKKGPNYISRANMKNITGPLPMKNRLAFSSLLLWAHQNKYIQNDDLSFSELCLARNTTAPSSKPITRGNMSKVLWFAGRTEMEETTDMSSNAITTAGTTKTMLHVYGLWPWKNNKHATCINPSKIWHKYRNLYFSISICFVHNGLFLHSWFYGIFRPQSTAFTIFVAEYWGQYHKLIFLTLLIFIEVTEGPIAFSDVGLGGQISKQSWAAFIRPNVISQIALV